MYVLFPSLSRVHSNPIERKWEVEWKEAKGWSKNLCSVLMWIHFYTIIAQQQNCYYGCIARIVQSYLCIPMNCLRPSVWNGMWQEISAWCGITMYMSVSKYFPFFSSSNTTGIQRDSVAGLEMIFFALRIFIKAHFIVLLHFSASLPHEYQPR